MLGIDYEHMWKKLRWEMRHLSQAGVTCLHPVIILGYMDFLEQIEQAKVERKNEATT